MKPSVLLVGDSIIDSYVSGTASRLSPEAPVPVLVPNVPERRVAGGVANVASNVASMGNVSVSLACPHNSELRVLLPSSVHLLTQESSEVTVKQRYCVGHHQLLRVDRDIAATPVDLAVVLSNKANVVILSDYRKGFLPPTTHAKLLTSSYVILDTKSDLRAWSGSFDVATPNESELRLTIGAWNSEAHLHEMVRSLLLDTGGNLLLTRSERGCTLFTRSGGVHQIPCSTKSVADVTGAGDVLVAALAVCRAEYRMNLVDAAIVANDVAGLSVARFGSVCMGRSDLEDCIHQRSL